VFLLRYPAFRLFAHSRPLARSQPTLRPPLPQYRRSKPKDSPKSRRKPASRSSACPVSSPSTLKITSATPAIPYPSPPSSYSYFVEVGFLRPPRCCSFLSHCKIYLVAASLPLCHLGSLGRASSTFRRRKTSLASRRDSPTLSSPPSLSPTSPILLTNGHASESRRRRVPRQPSSRTGQHSPRFSPFISPALNLPSYTPSPP
jgi:hypothetical protein